MRPYPHFYINWQFYNRNFICASTSLQVSTPTGIISHFVNLQVVVPEAFILGSGELHVDMGSTINLVCIIEKVSTETHPYIHIYTRTLARAKKSKQEKIKICQGQSTCNNKHKYECLPTHIDLVLLANTRKCIYFNIGRQQLLPRFMLATKFTFTCHRNSNLLG